MGDLLIRRRGLISQDGAAAAPLYPLDGTHALGTGASLVVSDTSHWKVSGTGAVDNKIAFSYPKDLFINRSLTYEVSISNFTIISGGTTSNKYVYLGVPGTSDRITLFHLSDGNGTFQNVHMFTTSDSDMIQLYLYFGWTSSFSYEFDLKLFADGKWIS